MFGIFMQFIVSYKGVIEEYGNLYICYFIDLYIIWYLRWYESKIMI